jgi:hypothetical protein
MRDESWLERGANGADVQNRSAFIGLIGVARRQHLANLAGLPHSGRFDVAR